MTAATGKTFGKIGIGAIALSAVAFTLIGIPSSTNAAPAGCPAGNFPDLSTSVGAGAGYDKPMISASCANNMLTVKSNGMISYPFTPKTPNSLKSQTWTWTIPVSPTVAKTKTAINTKMGTIGFTVTGIPIYGPMEGPVPAAEAYGDPVYNGILDSCGGHTGPASEYHDHYLGLDAQCNLSQRKVLGYALDGFPIYNAKGCLNAACTKTATFKSGYVQTKNPKTDAWGSYTYKSGQKGNVLDACNGRMEPDGTYGYHATTTFPYIIGCYKGTPVTQSGAAAGPMPPMGSANGPVVGGAPAGGPPPGGPGAPGAPGARPNQPPAV